MKVEQFEDAGCTMKQTEFSASASFTIGNESILTSGTTVRKIDFNNIRWFLALDDDDLVVTYNSDQVCGNANWQRGRKVDVTNCAVFDLPTALFDIFKVDGTNLFFGDLDFGNALSENNRPSQLSDDFYTKS